MATRKEKVESMSENHGVSTSESNDWMTFTLHSTDDEFDIDVRVHPDYFKGCDPASIFKMAQTKYTHVIGQEASSATVARDEAKFPDAVTFMRQWRLNKKASIVSGEYAERVSGGPRGPRLTDEDKELRLVAISNQILPRWLKAGNPEKDFPKNGKGLINGQTLDFWVDAVVAKYPELRVKAQQNVAAAKAQVEAAKAALSDTADAFADLAA